MGGGVIMIKVVGILMVISIIIVGVILYNLQNVKSKLISKMIVLTLFLSSISIGLNYFFPEITFPFMLPLLVVLAAFVVCAMIWEAIQYPKTVARIIKQFTLPNVLFLLLVGSALFLTARLDLIQYILYCIGILGAMIFILLVIEAKKKQKNHEISLLADIPLESKEELVPSRQQDLIHIKRLLEINNYREPFAMMINDDWGTGKTSLINVLMKDLEEEGHYIIFMQPMVWDDQHKMMDYFFSQLESLLYEKGIYTGKNSAFERYANLITQTLNTAHQSAVYGADLWKSFVGNQQPTNYREQKKQLEEDISLLLGEADKHIYLIVDDCDRVDEGVFKQVLMFIKEVVNFRGIDVLFLMDESKVAANDATLTPEYLEKFVNDKYTLNPIGYVDIYKHYYNKHIKSLNLENEQVIKVRKSLEKVIENDVTKNKMMNLRKAKLFIRQQVLILTTLENVAKNAQDEKELKSFEANLEAVSETLQSYIQTLLSIKLFYPSRYTEVDKAQFKTILFDDNAKKKEYDIDQEFQEILLNHQKVCKKSGHKRKDTILLIEQVFFEFILSARELNEKIFKEIRGKEEHFEHLMDTKQWSEIKYTEYPLDKCLKYMKRKGEIDSELNVFLENAPKANIYEVCFTEPDRILPTTLGNLCEFLYYPNYKKYFWMRFEQTLGMEHMYGRFIESLKNKISEVIQKIENTEYYMPKYGKMLEIASLEQLKEVIENKGETVAEKIFSLQVEAIEVELRNRIILKELLENLKYLENKVYNSDAEYQAEIYEHSINRNVEDFRNEIEGLNSYSKEDTLRLLEGYEEYKNHLSLTERVNILNQLRYQFKKFENKN